MTPVTFHLLKKLEKSFMTFLLKDEISLFLEVVIFYDMSKRMYIADQVTCVVVVATFKVSIVKTKVLTIRVLTWKKSKN